MITLINAIIILLGTIALLLFLISAIFLCIYFLFRVKKHFKDDVIILQVNKIIGDDEKMLDAVIYTLRQDFKKRIEKDDK